MTLYRKVTHIYILKKMW